MDGFKRHLECSDNWFFLSVEVLYKTYFFEFPLVRESVDGISSRTVYFQTLWRFSIEQKFPSTLLCLRGSHWVALRGPTFVGTDEYG